jgi:hypothetical protein
MHIHFLDQSSGHLVSAASGSAIAHDVSKSDGASASA